MAEILSTKYGYLVEIFTSNAIDFKALRSPTGKIITEREINFKKVNDIKVSRFPVIYNKSLSDMVNQIKKIDAYQELNLNDSLLEEILKNGPFLLNLLDNYLKLDRFQFNLIHTTYYPYLNILISLLLGKHFDVPVIITPFFHISNPRYLNQDLMKILKKFDLLIACTNTEKEFLSTIGGVSKKLIKVIPMGVDFEMFSLMAHRKSHKYQFKEKFFLENEKNYKMVLFCGYKNFEKGAISILNSIPYILQKYKKVYFVFIGPGTIAYNRELSRIKKNPSVRIINLTPQNLKGYYDEKKIAAFREADIYLMPSRSDAFGISFLEAWSAGKPVIGANIGATPEVIKNDNDGLLVNFDDPKDISEKVIRLLKNKRLRRRLGNNGKVKVERCHTWDVIAQKHDKIYKNLIP
ncbi:MAG: glycosyltransferase family 4 protein [Promethearchaeota archaeon]